MSRPQTIQQLRQLIKSEKGQRSDKGTILRLGPGGARATVRTAGRNLDVELPRSDANPPRVGDPVYLLYLPHVVMGLPVGQRDPIDTPDDPLPPDQNTVKEDFDGYGLIDGARNPTGVLNWVQLLTAEPNAPGEVFADNAGRSAAYARQGGYSAYFPGSDIVANYGQLSRNVSSWWGQVVGDRFTLDDFLCFHLRIYAAQNETWWNLASVFLSDGVYNGTWEYLMGPGAGYTDMYVSLKLSSIATEFFNPENTVNVTVTHGIGWFDPPYGGSGDAYFDNVQLVRADPQNSEQPNPTGDVWDFYTSDAATPGAWFIFENEVPGVPFVLAQIQTAAGKRFSGLLAGKTYNVIDHAVLGVRTREDSALGLLYAAQDAYNCYEIRLDTAGDTVKLLKWVGGASAELGSYPFPASPNVNYYLGVERLGSDLRIYASTSEQAVFTPGGLCLHVPGETTYAGGGKLGVVCEGQPSYFYRLRGGSPEYVLQTRQVVNTDRLAGLSSGALLSRLTFRL